jgi:hypothetical protein
VLLLNECLFVVSVYFVIDLIRKLLDTLSYSVQNTCPSPETKSPPPQIPCCKGHSYRRRERCEVSTAMRIQAMVFILKMEAARSSETSVPYHIIARRHNRLMADFSYLPSATDHMRQTVFRATSGGRGRGKVGWARRGTAVQLKSLNYL